MEEDKDKTPVAEEDDSAEKKDDEGCNGDCETCGCCSK